MSDRPGRAVFVHAQCRAEPGGPSPARSLRRKAASTCDRPVLNRRRTQSFRRGTAGRAGARPDQGVPEAAKRRLAREADVIVTMGCGDTCPVYPGKRYVDWDLDDPAGQPVEVVRPIVEDIDRRTRSLLIELLGEAALEADGDT